ncbi:hypothetical protein CBR_g4120 [Chara braunii]|uniref:t-SNARE coiled-coil homology domain-containing protein n=1 Tax=Chara braunii TaxID=69332 RepID=A0A388KHB8_CHABU|nr:hypothetical protein CBR_g4120 [Chara braunii]|eukprot:GBG69426.1 hypothetical protein CBR_g4120 [Chara braunii]
MLELGVKENTYMAMEEMKGQDSVNKVNNSFAKWKLAAPGSVDQIMLSHELMKSCDSVDWQVDELDRAISVAERDLARFGLDLAEIDRRRKWTSATKQQIALIRRAAAEVATPSRDLVKERRELMRLPNGPGAGGPGGISTSMAVDSSRYGGGSGGAGGGGGGGGGRGGSSSASNPISRENDDFVSGQMSRQAMILKEQDDQLDDLHESVLKVGEVGLTIGRALAEQESLLSELEMDLDSTRGKLDLVQRKVVNILKKAGVRGQIMLLCFLIVLLIVLIVLVFYT